MCMARLPFFHSLLKQLPAGLTIYVICYAYNSIAFVDYQRVTSHLTR